MNKIEDEEEKKELKEEYNRLLLKWIHFKNIRMEKIEKEN